MVKRLFRGLIGLSKFYLGIDRSDELLAMQRRLTCLGCRHKNKETCLLCGCIIEKKIYIKSEKCPVDKW